MKNSTFICFVLSSYFNPCLKIEGLQYFQLICNLFIPTSCCKLCIYIKVDILSLSYRNRAGMICIPLNSQSLGEHSVLFQNHQVKGVNVQYFSILIP